MKVQPSVKRVCRNCKVIRRKGLFPRLQRSWRNSALAWPPGLDAFDSRQRDFERLVVECRQLGDPCAQEFAFLDLTPQGGKTLLEFGNAGIFRFRRRSAIRKRLLPDCLPLILSAVALILPRLCGDRAWRRVLADRGRWHWANQTDIDTGCGKSGLKG